MLVSVGELISKSFAFAKEHWKKYVPFVGVMILAMIPNLGFFLLSLYKPSIIFSLLLLITVIGMIYASLLINIAIVRSTKKLFDKQSIENVSMSLRDAKPLVGALFVSSLIFAACVIGGAILFIIPGIIFAVWYMFFAYEVVFNNQRGMAALNESKKIVSGRWWAVLWRMIGPALPVVIFFGVVQAVVGTSVAGTAVYSIVSFVAMFFTMPYQQAAQFMLYQDLKAKPVTAPVQK
jgi:hypothetical protein